MVFVSNTSENNFSNKYILASENILYLQLKAVSMKKMSNFIRNEMDSIESLIPFNLVHIL